MKTILRIIVRCLLRPILSPGLPLKWQRRLLGLMLAANFKAPGTCIDRVEMGGVAGLRIAQASRRTPLKNRIVLYFHGGGYVLGTPAGVQCPLSYLALAADCEIYAPRYRLAPENPYPAALDDAVASYMGLIEQGYDRRNIVIGGDSAGGGLALLTAQALRDRGLPAPASLVLISPWTDLSLSSDSVHSHQHLDPMLKSHWLRSAAQSFAASAPTKSPKVSPLFADLEGLPPLLIHVGSDEILLDDSRRLAEKARAAGGSVDLVVHEGLWHVFLLHGCLLKHAMQAIRHSAAFIRTQTTQYDLAWK